MPEGQNPSATAAEPEKPLLPLNHIKLRQAVAERIKSAIADGVFEPGAKLPPEHELASMLHVGRSSVREALKQLEGIGLVHTSHGEGTFVNESGLVSLSRSFAITWLLDQPHIMELVEVRRLIETESAKRAARSATEADLEEMEYRLRRLQATAGDIAVYVEEDFAFHLAIAKASHNSLLAMIVESLGAVYKQELAFTARSPGAIERGSRYHREIFEAIAERDEQRAAAKMMGHLDDVEKILRSFLKDSENR